MLLIWMDLETTGLDPRGDRILEVAWATTTLDQPFDIGLVTARVLHFPEHWVHEQNETVRAMHTKNGLWEACVRSDLRITQVESELLDAVPAPQPGDDYAERPTLAGASVHFDRGFLCAHMPTLASRLSHRVYDTSAIKLFCRSLGMPKPPKEEAHRAAPDVREAVAHAKACSDWLKYSFRSPTATTRGLF